MLRNRTATSSILGQRYRGRGKRYVNWIVSILTQTLIIHRRGMLWNPAGNLTNAMIHHRVSVHLSPLINR
jgi:hypothetical protein